MHHEPMRSSLALPLKLRARASAIPAISLVIFALALFLRLGIFVHSHAEGDERIYRALVEQLDNGKGYTLREHPVLHDVPGIRGHDGPLFQYPPAGIALFWALHAALGDWGLGLAQILCFALFFWSTLGLAQLVLGDMRPVDELLLGLLTGFTPIVAHVGTKYWLDGPQVALATCASYCFVAAVLRRRLIWALPAGVCLGLACLVKLHAVLVVPGMALVAFFSLPAGDSKNSSASHIGLVLRPLAITLGVAAVFIVPWLFALWRDYATIFPSWSGRPTPEMLSANRFVHYVTVMRSPWIYLGLFPATLATLLPSIALGWIGKDRRSNRLVLALALWIAVVIGCMVALGSIGYSKLLRYTILASPAAVLLFGLAVKKISFSAIEGGQIWLRCLLIFGFLTEVLLGIKILIVDYQASLIFPLLPSPW